MRNEVICGCFNVTKGDLEDGILNGDSTFEDFQEKTSIGTGCPPCLEKNQILFKEKLEQHRLSLIDKIIVL